MNPREAGFLLLTSHLGNPSRNPLTPAQLRRLAGAVTALERPGEDRELTENDLHRLGYSGEMARRILKLLGEDALLDYYVTQGKKQGCVPLTRVSEGYPALLRQRLGLDSPGCLWAKGDVTLLNRPAISLVGSRDLRPENRAFARRVGASAAENGWVLVSGNARGADREGQNACLEAGGKVISVVADELCRRMPEENVLFLSEDGFGEPFTAQRALSRNRCIHALGQITFVAQCTLHKGGTWGGTVRNLRQSWNTVVCFRDGSEASEELARLGAYLLDIEDLEDFSLLPTEEKTFFTM